MYRLRNYSCDNAFAQVDFPKMKRGGVSASFFAAYVPAFLKDSAAKTYAISLLDVLSEQLEANGGKDALKALSSEDVRKNSNAGLISILCGIENGSALDGKEENIEFFFKRGVRYITLTHSADNELCDSCTGRGSNGGLSPLGYDMVQAMNQNKMLIDLAHSSAKTMSDVLDVSTVPVAYTHGCCSALCGHPRNISDDLIRRISDRGGIVCMSIYPDFLDDGFKTVLSSRPGLAEKADAAEKAFISEPSNPAKADAWVSAQKELQYLPRPGVEVIARHIKHAVEVGGVEHVGIGTDYDGIEYTASGLEDISSFSILWDALRAAGLRSSEIEKIAGENFLQVLDDVKKG